MQHDMTMVLVLNLNEDQVRSAASGERLTFKNVDSSDKDLVREFFVACMRCEMSLEVIADEKKTNCPGEPAGYDNVGLPYWSVKPGGSNGS